MVCCYGLVCFARVISVWTTQTIFRFSRLNRKFPSRLAPDTAELIRQAAAARQMDPDAYLAILLKGQSEGETPLWRKASSLE